MESMHGVFSGIQMCVWLGELWVVAAAASMTMMMIDL